MPKKSGFTLIELLVVIAIIGILTTIGVSTYTGAQKNARDARRKIDIDAIASALEANKLQNSSTYQLLSTSMFAQGNNASAIVPVDSVNSSTPYCVAYKVAAGSTPPANPTIWAVGACPTAAAPWSVAGVSPWSADASGTISTTLPPATATSWTACALLETGTAPNFYCRQSTQ